VLGAPVPFIVGLHSSFLQSTDCAIPDEAVTVYLDDNRIEYGLLGPPPQLPDARGRKLVASVSSLTAAAFTERMEPWRKLRLPYFDSAFNMSVRPDRANGTMEQGKSAIDEKAVRESFLRFFVAVMKNYRKYVFAASAAAVCLYVFVLAFHYCPPCCVLLILLLSTSHFFSLLICVASQVPHLPLAGDP
jgi:hypothetical protein